MSREVRRVPLDWKHPTEPNPYWRQQTESALRRGDNLSRLHLPQEQFVGLVDDYAGALERWQEDVDSVASRTGRHWTFHVEYHLTGFRGCDDTEPTVRPFYYEAADGSEFQITVRDEAHLQELMASSDAEAKPDPAQYMPQFEGDSLGWCLYETVSEGTPITPVFATAEELVDHLVEHGEDWRQEPYRRVSAEAMVRDGSSMASMVFTGGVMYDGARDLDVLGGAS